MRHEGFAVVLADVTLRVETSLAPKVTGELAAVGVLDNNDILLPKDPADLSGMERNDPFYLKLIRDDSFFAGEFFDGFANRAVRRTPADQCDGGVFRPKKFGRRDVVNRSLHFAAAFLDHHPALVRVGK